MQFLSPDDEHMCSKHVRAWNKLIVKQKFCASSLLITDINSTVLSKGEFDPSRAGVPPFPWRPYCTGDHTMSNALEQGYRTDGTRKYSLGMRHSTLSQFFYFFCPTSVSILCRICLYTYTYLTPYRLYMNYGSYQITMQWNIFTQIWSGAKCWLDIYHWGAGLAVTEWIFDIGQKVEQSSFETGSSSSNSYCHILLRNIIIIIIMCI